MASIFHSGLSKDLSFILNDADDFNVIINVGENKNTKEFQAHSVILRARSPYFKSALATEWITKKNNMIIFNKPNITPSVFDLILKYIYTGELDLANQSGEVILGLLIATDELLLEELFQHVQLHLIEKQISWIQNNFVLVLHTVFNLTNCKKLQDYCLESICKDPKPYITSETFPSLEKNILYDLIKRDDFSVEEIDIWNCLIKWGIEQTPGLKNMNSDEIKWNNDNYEALKKTLDQFIPLIRFLEISSYDFFDKVRPYKAIIPHHIYDEIDEFYYKKTLPESIILSPRIEKSVSLASTIIEPRLATIISNLIDRKDSTITNNNKYRYNLIYLMSRDGFDHVTFFDKCNRQGSFVVLVRVQSKKIYGGYNPIGYTGSNRWLSSTESFVFSFENHQDINNMKISRSTNTDCSIFDCNWNNGYFFNFGGMLFINKHHLLIGYNTSYYDNIFDKIKLPIEEIEVFNVMKK